MQINSLPAIHFTVVCIFTDFYVEKKKKNDVEKYTEGILLDFQHLQQHAQIFKMDASLWFVRTKVLDFKIAIATIF